MWQPGLLQRAVSRHLWREPWQLGLAILGIALGVAVVCAVQLTQASARQALAYAHKSLNGPATHRLEAANGDDYGLDERDYARLARRWPRLRLLPIVGGRGTLELDAPYPVAILGVDLLAATTGPDAARRLGANFDLATLLTRPGTALLNHTTARRLGVALGDSVACAIGGRTHRIEIAGIAPAARDGGPADDALVMDIASAQEILGAAGRLSAVDVVLPAAERRDLLATLRADLPAGWRLTSYSARLAATREMTQAFEINLTALSLLALLVGMFLVYNTVSFLALQRRALFTRLRALGVSARELFGALLIETAALGAIGVASGIVLGRVVARALLALVARTVNDLYYRSAITEVVTPAWLLAGIAALGLTATLAAALPPLRAVTRETVAASSRERLEAPPASAFRPLLAAGFACGLGGALLLWPGRALWPGFGALFAFLIAAAIPLPWLLTRGARALSLRPGLTLPLLLASRALAAYGRRAGLAAAALMVACATGLAVTVMVASFRASVTDWLETLLRADVYVDLGVAGGAVGSERPLAALRARIAALPEVAATSSVIRAEVGVAGVVGDVQLLAYDLPPAARAGFQIIAGDAARIWAAWEREDIALVTEPYAYRHRVRVGDDLRVETARGERRLRIAGIYRDYASERGSVAIARPLWQRYFPPRDDSSLGVYARAGVASAALERAIYAASSGASGLRVRSNANLRAVSLEVFDRTFAVTDLLRILTLGVAVVGIVSVLLAQQMERLTDYALLRAVGLRTPEIARVVLWQTGLIGAFAATVALPVGLGLALLLIDVINVRSFGWTMSLHWSWSAVGHLWLSALGAALLAGAYPAFVVTRRTPASVLRNE